MIFFSIVKELSKMVFFHFTHMRLGLVSFAFSQYDWFGYAKSFLIVIMNHYSFNQKTTSKLF